MRRLHPLTVALLAASGLPVTTRRPEETEQHPPEPPLGKTLAANQQRLYQKGRQMGLRNLMGGPVRMHRPEAPNKPQAPSNPKADERRAARLRDTIMKRAFWNVAMWDMSHEDRGKLYKAGISTHVVQQVLSSEPPPKGSGIDWAAYQQMQDALSPEQRQAIADRVLHQCGMKIIDDSGPVPREVWDSVATEQTEGERHDDADSVGGDGVRDPGRG